jgi:hypothetical protein
MVTCNLPVAVRRLLTLVPRSVAERVFFPTPPLPNFYRTLLSIALNNCICVRKMPSPAAVLDGFDSTEERRLLQEVLRRKLVKVPPALYPQISLDQILAATGADDLFPYHE